MTQTIWRRDSSFIMQKPIRNSDGNTPTEAPNASEIGKNAFFDRLKSLRLRRPAAENLCPSDMIVRVGHDGALAEEYAVLSTTLVVVKVCLSYGGDNLQRSQRNLAPRGHRLWRVFKNYWLRKNSTSVTQKSYSMNRYEWSTTFQCYNGSKRVGLAKVLRATKKQ